MAEIFFDQLLSAKEKKKILQEHIAREYSFNVKDGGTMNPTYLTSPIRETKSKWTD